MKGFLLPVNIKCSDSQQRQEGPYGLGTWQGVLGGSAVSLAMAKKKPKNGRPLLLSQCSLVKLLPLSYLSIQSTHLVGTVFFFAATAEKQKVTFENFKGSLTLKRPPYSCRGSKDGGYADCQLGVPMRAISSQRKIDVSKGNPEESAVLWRGHKIFYAAGR